MTEERLYPVAGPEPTLRGDIEQMQDFGERIDEIDQHRRNRKRAMRKVQPNSKVQPQTPQRSS